MFDLDEIQFMNNFTSFRSDYEDKGGKNKRHLVRIFLKRWSTQFHGIAEIVYNTRKWEANKLTNSSILVDVQF